jgi:GntR family phosphonate transport system transcriptional regulator
MTLFEVSSTDQEPLYIQIARVLETDILARLSPGDWLASENDLARQFGVNRHTLRRAIDQLIDTGLLERHQGRGTLVLNTYLDYAIGSTTRFTETLNAQGKNTETVILHKRHVLPVARVAERLKIKPQASVLWIESLRLSDGNPMCVISHFLPLAPLKGLMDSYTGGSLHQHLKKVYGFELRRSESLITATMPEGDDCRHLLYPQNKPLLRVKSLNVDAHSGTPLEYAVTRFRADRVQLRINP